MVRSVLASVLRFRLLVVGVAAGLLVFGAISLRQMHNDALPELGSGPVEEVQTAAPGLSSQEVEQYVTVPLENNLLDGIMGVWDVRSNSVPGLSSVDLYFEPGTTELHARQLVQERLTNAFSLPNVTKPPLLIQPLSSSSRVMMIGLRSSAMSSLELSYLARWIVKPRLSGVPGVANVAIFGQQDQQMQVQVDPAKLAAHGVTLSQVISTAGNAQLVSPLTYLQGATPGTGGFLDGPNQRLDIRPVLPLGVPSALASVPISGAPGRPTLGSVANVILGHQPLNGGALLSNGTGLVLLVQKLPSASVTAVTQGVERALADLRPALGKVSIDTSVFRPQSYVSQALHDTAVGLLIAALLGALAIAALFLELRTAFVALAAVSVSLLVALLVLEALGYTFNPILVLGLLIALGVLADDAVGSVGELLRSMQARRAAGERARSGERLLDGLAAVRGTLGYATLIVLLSITPVLVSKGLSATFLHPMLLSFALAVIASTVVALTLVPALALLLLEPGVPRPRRLAVTRAVGDAYRRALQASLALPREAVLGVCLVGVAGLIALPFLHQPAAPRFKDRNLVVQWDGPAGTALSEMDRVTARAIAELRALPAVANVAATLGQAVSADQVVDTNSGQLYVTIKPSANYDGAVSAVRSIVEGTPGIRASVSTYEADVTSGVLAPANRQVTVRVYGEDYGVLAQLGGRVSSLLSRIHGVGTPRVQMPTQQPNIGISIQDAAALNAGVLPGDARREASTLVYGLTVGNFFQNQAVFDVTVSGIPSEVSTLNQVRNLLLDTSNGGHVRLDQVAQVKIEPDPVDIQHEALSRYLDVTAAVPGADVGSVQSAIAGELGQVHYPLGYHAEVVGGTPNDPTSHVAFLSYVLVAAVGVFLLLQAALRSWRLAAALFLALPVALLGGILVALLIGQLDSVGTDAGLVAVFALAARQGTVLIAHLRRLQARDGGPLTPVIVIRGASERFAPTIGAVFVTAAALIPFAVMGDVAGNELTHTAAAVMLGGILGATALNLLLVPAVCLAVGPIESVAVDEPGEVPSLAASTPSSSLEEA